MIEHYTLLTRKQAETEADRMNSEDEDGWTYRPVHDPEGTSYSYIEIYDEDNILLGRF